MRWQGSRTQSVKATFQEIAPAKQRLIAQVGIADLDAEYERGLHPIFHIAESPTGVDWSRLRRPG